MCKKCPPGTPYASAYKETESAKLSLWFFCPKCPRPVRMKDEIGQLHRGEIWTPILRCTGCGLGIVVNLSLDQIHESIDKDK